MGNIWGRAVRVTLFGESHGETIGAVLDGLAAGVAVNDADIARQLSLRSPGGIGSTARREPDDFRVVSGVRAGRSTGAPITVLIPNRDVKSEDYDSVGTVVARPGHADFTAAVKYRGFADARGGGHFSGRLTAALVAVGAIARRALEDKGIRVATHIARLGGVADRPFSAENLAQDMERVNGELFAVLDNARGEAMRAEIARAAEDADSLGGVLETVVTGLPVGVGEPWFEGVESVLAQGLFAIPAVKGVEFGDGFSLADMRGSQANDAFCLRDGRMMTETNHCGGILGGITDGMPLCVRCAVKPTPTIGREQKTVNLKTVQETTLCVSGRHDVAIVPRARAVVDAVAALGLCDLLTLRYGSAWLGESD